MIKGEIYAFGFRVLSDEYSNPSLIILTWFALPTDFEAGIIYAPDPVAKVPIPIKLGNLLYPNPLKSIPTLWTPPVAVRDVVLYSKVLASDDVYDNLSGTCLNNISNVVAAVETTSYLPLYKLSAKFMNEWFLTWVSAVLINPLFSML